MSPACGYAAFLRGTFAPFLRASESPIAIACFRLFTVPPLPPGPDFNVPRFFLRMALFTVLPAALPYFRPLDFFFPAMSFLLSVSGKSLWQGWPKTLSWQQPPQKDHPKRSRGLVCEGKRGLMKPKKRRT